MAIDERLAARVRRTRRARCGMSEKKTFGGVASPLGDDSCCAVDSSQRVARIGPAAADAALVEPRVKVFAISGRPTNGWIVVAEPDLGSDGAPARRVGLGAAFAATLPAK